MQKNYSQVNRKTIRKRKYANLIKELKSDKVKFFVGLFKLCLFIKSYNYLNLYKNKSKSLVID